MTQPLTAKFVNKKIGELNEDTKTKGPEKAVPTKSTRSKVMPVTLEDLPEDPIYIPVKVKLIPYSTGNFRLGLEKTTENFMRLPGCNYRWAPDKKGNRFLTGLQFISAEKQAWLETEMGVSLNDEFYGDLDYLMDGSSPHGVTLDLRKPRELVIYLAMLDSKLVARTRTDKAKGLKPEADWYIEDLEAEAEIDSAERDKFLNVTKKYGDLSNDKKMNICKLFMLPVRGLSPKVADAQLWKKLTDNKDKNYQKTLDRFLEIVGWSDTKLNIAAELEDAIALNVIRRNGAQDFVYGEDNLGSTKDQVLSKLLQGDGSLRNSIVQKLTTRQ